jgi:hypothetical protein
MIEVYVAGPKSTVDVMKVGDSFSDPVFGTFSLDFASVTPELMGSDKAKLEILPSGDDYLTATFMDYRGNTKTFTWAYDADSIDLTDGANYPYIVVEGQQIAENQYFVVDSGGYSHVFQLSNVDIDGTTTGSVEFTDIFTGVAYDVIMGTNNQSTKVIDGQTYYINGTVGSSLIKVTWGTNAGYTTVS